MVLCLPFSVIESKCFFFKNYPIWFTDPKVFFRNRKWNYLSRKSNHFYHFQSSDQKFILQNFTVWSDDSKMISGKQEMEFYKSFHIWSTASKLVFRNRDWNYLNRKWNYFSPFHLSDQKSYFTKVTPFGSLIRKWFPENRKWNYLKRKWNYFSPFGLSDQKTFFTKVSLFGLLLPNWFSETGNWII